MMPLRLVMFVCYALWYKEAGKLHPWVRSLFINACGFAVNIALDMRYRYLYSLHVHRQAHSSGAPVVPGSKIKKA